MRSTSLDPRHFAKILAVNRDILMNAKPAFAAAHCAAAQGWRPAVETCLVALNAPADAKLGFVYATDALAGDLPAIVRALKERTGIRHWVGSLAIGIAGGDREYFDEPALAVMAAALPDGAFRVLPNVTRPAEARRGVAGRAEEDGGAIGVVHADPRNPDLAELVAATARHAGGFLVGGLASSRGLMRQVAGDVVEGGISGVVIASGIAVVSGLSQGCSPIGPRHTITACERNVVFEIDGQPALEILKQDLGQVLARRLERIGGYIHAALPVAGSDTGDYLVRNLVGIDPDRGWVAIGELVAAGDSLLFVRRDRETAEHDLARMANQLRRRAGSAPRAGLYFSCLARGPNLFGPDSAELAILRRALGEFPLVGMFCNGEISNDRLYGYTGVLLLFL
ncbi:MAG TPA: FIST N-terminal domain-containing protein [Alphaproteobacteria bacterium]|nr:FIST N-terminal domain-containing protein [Alphaproteobacteria bacterium]